MRGLCPELNCINGKWAVFWLWSMPVSKIMEIFPRQEVALSMEPTQTKYVEQWVYMCGEKETCAINFLPLKNNRLS